MPSNPQKTAQLLLDAQTKFLLNDLKSEQFAPILKSELEYLYQQLDDILLNDAISCDDVKATAHRYAIEMEIGGAIPELFGEIANIVYEHPNNDRTLLQDIITDDNINDLLTKIFERGSLLDQAANTIADSSAFNGLISDITASILKGILLENNIVINNVPFVGKGLRKIGHWINQKAPTLSDNAEELIRAAMEKSVHTTLQLTQELLQNNDHRDDTFNSAMTFWDEAKTWPVSRFQDYMSEMDLQEFMVLGYEFWLDFRHTEYLKSFIDAGVDFFFQKYGEDSLQNLVTEMGVTQDMIIAELSRHTPKIMDLLIEKGVAETIIRRHLQRFYFDEDTLSILQAE